MDGCIDEKVNGWMIKGWMNDGWNNGYEWMMDVWMDKWMDG